MNGGITESATINRSRPTSFRPIHPVTCHDKAKINGQGRSARVSTPIAAAGRGRKATSDQGRRKDPRSAPPPTAPADCECISASCRGNPRVRARAGNPPAPLDRPRGRGSGSRSAGTTPAPKKRPTPPAPMAGILGQPRGGARSIPPAKDPRRPKAPNPISRTGPGCAPRRQAPP